MTVAECQKRMSYREFLTWVAWLDLQWDNPSRTDSYLMQIAYEVHQVLRARKNVKAKNFKLKFSKETRKPLTRQESGRRSESAWLAAIGEYIVKEPSNGR